MKKILFVLSLVLLFSCEKYDEDRCERVSIRIYSPSGLIPERNVMKEVCGDELREYKEGTRRSPLCNDCMVTIKYW